MYYIFQLSRRTLICRKQQVLLGLIYLVTIQMPSKSSDQIVEAALPFRFRLAPNNFGNGGNHGSFGRTHSLLGSHDTKLLNYLYPSNSFSSHRNKRSYADLQCRGIYDPSIFARLERVCEDCYNLYKDDEVHGLCR